VEVAPGVDPEADVIAHMGFRPRVAEDMRTMDQVVFASGPMGIAERYQET
jgi:propionate CoA-transferase